MANELFEIWMKQKYGEDAEWDEGWNRYDMKNSFEAGQEHPKATSPSSTQAIVRQNKGGSLKETCVVCLCGVSVGIIFSGNNNADGKQKCECGRNITLHFRRNG